MVGCPNLGFNPLWLKPCLVKTVDFDTRMVLGPEEEALEGEVGGKACGEKVLPSHKLGWGNPCGAVSWVHLIPWGAM
jgi:hypothetical protein